MRPAAFGLIAILSACSAPAPKPVDYSKEIRDAESARMKAAASKDLDAFAAFYADDASILSPNMPILTGKIPIKDGLKPMLADPQFALILTPSRIEVSKKAATWPSPKAPTNSRSPIFAATSSKTKESF